MMVSMIASPGERTGGGSGVLAGVGRPLLLDILSEREWLVEIFRRYVHNRNTRRDGLILTVACVQDRTIRRVRVPGDGNISWMRRGR